MSEKERKGLSGVGDALRSNGKRPKSDISEVWASHKSKPNKPSQKITFSEIKDEFLNSKLVKNAKKKTNQTTKKIKSGSFKSNKPAIVHFFKKRKKLIIVFVAIFLLFNVFFGNGSQESTDKKPSSSDESRVSTSDQLGASTQVKTESARLEDLPVVTETPFDLIWPATKSKDDFVIYDAAPAGKEPAFLYSDELDGVLIRINQQKLPDDFKTNTAESIEKLSKDFSALNIIQIDGNKVYHGLSESNGEIQTLILSKEDLLIFIQSPKKISDDLWASYISALK